MLHYGMLFCRWISYCVNIELCYHGEVVSLSYFCTYGNKYIKSFVIVFESLLFFFLELYAGFLNGIWPIH